MARAPVAKSTVPSTESLATSRDDALEATGIETACRTT
jgi:hypothetical protein